MDDDFRGDFRREFRGVAARFTATLVFGLGLAGLVLLVGYVIGLIVYLVDPPVEPEGRYDPKTGHWVWIRRKE